MEIRSKETSATCGVFNEIQVSPIDNFVEGLVIGGEIEKDLLYVCVILIRYWEM